MLMSVHMHIVLQERTQLRPAALWGVKAGGGPLRVRYHRLWEGGRHICSCQMSCIFGCACADMYSRFRHAQGLDWQCFSRKRMFLADRGRERGDWAELNSCTKETKRKLVCYCCPACEAHLGVKAQDNGVFICLRQGQLSRNLCS